MLYKVVWWFARLYKLVQVLWGFTRLYNHVQCCTAFDKVIQHFIRLYKVAQGCKMLHIKYLTSWKVVELLGSPECHLSVIHGVKEDTGGSWEDSWWFLTFWDFSPQGANEPKMGPTGSKNIFIWTGSKSWPRRPSIIHFWEYFPEIFDL